jgi:nicotinamidase-related amidase
MAAAAGQKFIIEAEPYALEFDPAATALMVIDMQRDFLEPGGFGELLGNDVSLLRGAIEPTIKVLQAARETGLFVLHTREGHLPDLSDAPAAKLARGRLQTGIGDAGPMGRILVRGEPGHDIIPELAPIDGEPVIDKPGKGAFYATGLQEDLHRLGATHLIFTGVTTEVCVQTTIRKANDRGYECLLVEDATESYYPAFKQATLEMVRSSNALIGWTSTSDKVLAALAGI